MEWGEHDEWLRQAAAERGLDVPEAVRGQPQVPAHLDLYWRAFSALSTDRPLGFGGAGPIPWTAIDRYAARLGLGAEECERLAQIVGRVDEAFLGHMERRQKQRRDEAERQSRKGQRR